MAHYNTFEELPIWQESRKITVEVYKLTQNPPFCKDFGLRNQIQQASVSIISNIAEGFERLSDKEFRHFLNIAKASAGEVRSQLYVACDIGYISEEVRRELNASLKSLSTQIAGFMRYLDEERE